MDILSLKSVESQVHGHSVEGRGGNLVARGQYVSGQRQGSDAKNGTQIIALQTWLPTIGQTFL